MKRKNIIIVSSYFYLSAPLCQAISECIEDASVQLFYPKDHNGLEQNEKFMRTLSDSDLNQRISTVNFNWYYARFNCKNQIIGLIIKYFEIFFRQLSYKKALIKDLLELEPDVVIVLTDMNFSSRLVIDNIGDVNVLIMQPSFIDTDPNKSVKNLGLKTVLNKFVPNLFSMQPYFGLERTNVKLLAWGFKTLRAMEGRRETYAIANPILQRVSQKNGLENPVEPFSDKKPCRIVIFASDHHLLYGVKYLDYYKIEISKLLLKLAGVSWLAEVTVKIHPNDNLKNWQDFFQMTAGFNVIVTKDARSENLINDAHVAISTDSYVALEAMARGILVINYIPRKFDFPKKMCLDLDNRWYSCDSTNISIIEEFISKLGNEDDYGAAFKHAEQVCQYIRNGTLGPIFGLEEILLGVRSNIN